MEELIKVAAGELGIHEIHGEVDNQRIVQYAQEVGLSWINDDETPWCSIFVNWVAKQAGFEQSESASARSWLKVGFSIDHPEPGDVVVFWRDHPDSVKGHVGFFMGYTLDQSNIYTLGGNQEDAVTISCYPTERLLDFRRLFKIGQIKLPNIKLKKSDTGRAVARLQDALKLAGYDAGPSDGIFGPLTEQGLRSFQSSNLILEPTGIFDTKSRKSLLQLLNKA